MAVWRREKFCRILNLFIEPKGDCMFCSRGRKAHFTWVTITILAWKFRAEKRNKHARVLAVRQAPSLKTWRDFRRSSKQKRLRTLYSFEMFPISSNILTSLMESWSIVSMGNQIFRTKLTGFLRVTRKHTVHGPPLWTGSVDYLRTGPRTTPTDPSTDHPPNKIKSKNKDFTYCLSNISLVSAKFRGLRLVYAGRPGFSLGRKLCHCRWIHLCHFRYCCFAWKTRKPKKQ